MYDISVIIFTYWFLVSSFYLFPVYNDPVCLNGKAHWYIFLFHKRWLSLHKILQIRILLKVRKWFKKMFLLLACQISRSRRVEKRYIRHRSFDCTRSLNFYSASTSCRWQRKKGIDLVWKISDRSTKSHIKYILPSGFMGFDHVTNQIYISIHIKNGILLLL